MKKMVVLIALVMAVAVVNAQRTPVKVTDLPKGITEYVTKDYVGYSVKDAIKIVTNNVITYETIITKGSSQETLLFDKDGAFIKKLVAKEGMTANKNSNPQMKHIAHATTPVKK